MFYVLAATAAARLVVGCVEGARWATDSLVARKQKPLRDARAAHLAALMSRAEQEGKKPLHVLVSVEDLGVLSENKTFVRSWTEYNNLEKAGAFGGERT